MFICKSKSLINFIFTFFTTIFIAGTIISCNTNQAANNSLKGKANEPDTVLLRVFEAGKTDKMDVWFKNLCATTRFNGAILVAENGKIIYENALGYANYSKKDSLTVHSRFQLASISKQFTAVAILMLVDKKIISLDDPIEKFYPEFPYKNISIKMLLSHRSGLANYIYFCEKYTDKITPITNQDVMNIMIKYKPDPYMPANTRFHYCNTNYAILAAIIEKITNQKFNEYIQQNILDPLNMNNTFLFNPAQPDTLKNITTGYLYKWTKAEHVYQDGVWGDKGLYSTIEDLFRWDQALYSNKLISEELKNQAFSPQNPERKGVNNYGFGWRLRKQNDSLTFVYHGGWWRGYNGLFLRVPQHKQTIILLSNVRTKAFQNQYSDILKILDPVSYADSIDFEEKVNNNGD